jgi:tRNA (guanine26-N2/guanine27-N2)-dimethyltransferase
MKKFVEGETVIFAPEADVPTKSMEVFYNPNKAFCRDISILLIRALQKKWKKKFAVADCLAGTGARGIRMAVETGAEVYLNDKNPSAFRLMKKNVKANNIKTEVFNEDATAFLSRRKFDYVDIDPFGSPNPFLDAGIQALRLRRSVLAVCATDTATLSGTYPKATKRKYGSDILLTNFHDEVGLRILIKHVIEHGASLDIGLNPIFCHSTRHYFRCYFERVDGSKRIDKILQNIGYLHYDPESLRREISKSPYNTKMKVIGPLWIGRLYDRELVRAMMKDSMHTNFLNTILNEIDTVGYYLIPKIASKIKKPVPKYENIISALENAGIHVSKCHFDKNGLKIDADVEEIERVILKLS